MRHHDDGYADFQQLADEHFRDYIASHPDGQVFDAIADHLRAVARLECWTPERLRREIVDTAAGLACYGRCTARRLLEIRLHTTLETMETTQ